MRFTRDQYQRLIDQPNAKARYTSDTVYSNDVVCGSLESYHSVKLEIKRLGNRWFTLSNGTIIAGPSYNSGVLRDETDKAINRYFGPSNSDFCTLLKLSNRSQVDVEELVTNLKNTRLDNFSVYVKQGNLRYIRHNGTIEVDPDDMGRHVATIKLVDNQGNDLLWCEPIARIALAKAIVANES